MFVRAPEDRQVEVVHQDLTKTTIIALALLAVSLLSTMIGLQSSGAQHVHADHAASTADAWTRGNAFGRALAAAMDKMHKDMMEPTPTDNADVDFLATMIPHHAGAVEMARLVLIHGTDPLVRRLAEEIIAGQQAEIAAMQARLAILRRGVDPSPGDYPTLGSTRGITQ